MSAYGTAEDRFVQVGDVRFAYRLFGSPHGIPLLCIAGFRQHMDHWDPALLDPIAARRPVLLIDGAGTGRSGGAIPTSIAAMAAQHVGVLRALGLTRVDLLGFSMGGYVAQLMVLNGGAAFEPSVDKDKERAAGVPEMRRLILCATGPSSGEGLALPDPRAYRRIRTAVTEEEHREAFLGSFFIEGSERSMSAGELAWGRMAGARRARRARGRREVPDVSVEDGRKQMAACAEFMDRKNAARASFDRFHELRLPVLIAAGCNDVLMPSENSILMWQKLQLSDAQLHLYPDSGHGFLHQYAGGFAALVNLFLGADADAAGRKTGCRL